MIDLPGDDQAEFTGSSLRVRLGTGAIATGGSVTAVPGASTLRLAGGTIPRGGSCTVQGSCIRPSNSQVLDASKILCMRASSRALNSASDCWAVSPSTSAREKLATMP